MNDMTEIGRSRQLLERGQRALTLFIVAKLRRSDGLEGLCRIRNLSTGGLMFESLLPLASGERIALEVRGRTEPLTGTVIWTGEGRAGAAFDELVAIEEILALRPFPRSRLRRVPAPRGPRVEVDCAMEVQLDGGRVDAQLVDISQGGAKVLMPLTMQRHERAVLMIPGLPLKLALACWAGEETGFAFAEPLSYELLAEWLMLRQAGEQWDEPA